jgi:hypothetical protein
MPRLTQLTRLVLVMFSLGAAAFCSAQATKDGVTHIDSRVDIYGGYGYFHPINSGINGFQYQPVYNPNATVSVSAFFNHYFGVQIEGGYFSGTTEHKQYIPTCTGETCSQLIYTAEAGPVFRLPLGPFVPFAHLLGGGERTNGPAAQSLMWGWGVTGGVGVDYVLPLFNYRFAIRPIQADYQYSQVVYGPLLLPAGKQGGFGELDNIKLSAGLVARFGNVEPPYPVMLGCGAQPASVFPGDPVKVQANALHLNPKKTPAYSWASNGGKVMASGPEATVDTTDLAPGDYAVTGHVEEGSKARQQASCAAPFTVKAFEPPTLTCSANPSTAVSGTDIEISTVGTSPQNRPLTYSYTASAGAIASAGPTARLVTAGLSPGTITVTCNVVDDLGKSAQATTDVIITAPPVPVLPQTQQLCSLSFTRDQRRPVRVDNEAKGCLDDIALTLNQQADARLIIVGNSTPPEKPDAAAERTLNARQYLTQEKGIDPSRIELRIGQPSGKTVTNTLVPAGAIFNDLDTHTFDEKTIVRHGQAYGIPRLKKTLSKTATPAPAAAPPVTPTPTAVPTTAPTPVPAAPAPATQPPATTTPTPASPASATTAPATTAPETPTSTTSPATTSPAQTPTQTPAPASTPPTSTAPAPAVPVAVPVSPSTLTSPPAEPAAPASAPADTDPVTPPPTQTTPPATAPASSSTPPANPSE